MSLIDIGVIALYFLIVFGIGYWAACREKKESADYFLASRDVGWLAVGASLFASNIGSEHMVGLAGSGAESGLAVGHFEWLACLILLVLGWVFVPFYTRSGVYTMPEFLERRYNSASRWYLTVVSVIAYVLTKVSVSLFAGGIIIKEITGLDMWISAIIIVVATGIYTVAGGLRAVIYTELLQTFVLIFGSICLTVLGLIQVGGWQGLTQKVPAEFFSMWKPMDHPSFPWTGIVFGAPILGIWYWCTDQYIVQRVLAARNIGEARRGTILAGFLKILPVFIFVLPGLIATALYTDIRGENSSQALPSLVTRLLPVGLKGIFLAGLLAALMSSISSVFNSCSTLITWDFYKKWKPQASERELINVGRAATTVMVVLGLLWIPFMKYISPQLYIYLQSVQAYIAPPIAACFLLGLFLPFLNGAGAIVSLLTGFVLGALRLVLELMHGPAKNGLASGSAWAYLAEINFLHYAVLLFVVCTIVLVVVSLCTKRPDASKIAGLTYSSAAKSTETAKDSCKTGDIWLTLLLIGLLAFLWILFA